MKFDATPYSNIDAIYGYLSLCTAGLCPGSLLGIVQRRSPRKMSHRLQRWTGRRVPGHASSVPAAETCFACLTEQTLC